MILDQVHSKWMPLSQNQPQLHPLVHTGCVGSLTHKVVTAEDSSANYSLAY